MKTKTFVGEYGMDSQGGSVNKQQILVEQRQNALNCVSSPSGLDGSSDYVYAGL